jgi:hypothetical protein
MVLEMVAAAILLGGSHAGRRAAMRRPDGSKS